MLDAACVLSAAALEEARSGWGMEDDAPAALAGARRAQAELGGESAALALVLASGAVAGEQVQAAGGASAGGVSEFALAALDASAGALSVLLLAVAVGGDALRQAAGRLLANADADADAAPELAPPQRQARHLAAAQRCATLAALAAHMREGTREARAARHGALRAAGALGAMLATEAAAEYAQPHHTPRWVVEVAVWLAAAMVALGEGMSCDAGCC